MGKIFIILGIAFVILGIFLNYGSKIPGIRLLGHLPGDIYIKKEQISFYFPLVSSIVVSIVLTLIFQLIHYFKNK